MFIVGLTKKIGKNSSGKVYHRAKGNFCTVVGVDASFLVLHGSVSVSLVKFGTTKQSPQIDIKSIINDKETENRILFKVYCK